MRLSISVLFCLLWGATAVCSSDQEQVRICDGMMGANVILLPKRTQADLANSKKRELAPDIQRQNQESLFLLPNTMVTLKDDSEESVRISPHHQLVPVLRSGKIWTRYMVLLKNSPVAPVTYTSLLELEDLLFHFTQHDHHPQGEGWIQAFGFFLMGRLMLQQADAFEVAKQFATLKDSIPQAQVHRLRHLLQRQLARQGKVLVTIDSQGKPLH